MKCLSIVHCRDCKGIDYIPKIAKDIRTSPLYTVLRKNLRKLKRNYKKQYRAFKKNYRDFLKPRMNLLIWWINKRQNQSKKVYEKCKKVAKIMKATAFKSNAFLDE